ESTVPVAPGQLRSKRPRASAVSTARPCFCCSICCCVAQPEARPITTRSKNERNLIMSGILLLLALKAEAASRAVQYHDRGRFQENRRQIFGKLPAARIPHSAHCRGSLASSCWTVVEARSLLPPSPTTAVAVPCHTRAPVLPS